MSLNLESLRFSRLRLLALLFCIGWVSAIAWWHRGVVMDDPWITFRYAQNLLAGKGLVFNAGEPIEGYSNLSWVFASAAAIFARIEPLSFARLLGWCSTVAALALLCLGWKRDGSARHSVTAALLLAASYPVGVWISGGLETMFQMLLVLAMTLSLAELLAKPSACAAAILAAALATMDVTRPEGFLWLLPLLAALPWTRRADRSLPLLAVLIGAFVLFHGVYTFWRWETFGSLVANTAKAKVGGGLGHSLGAGARYLWSYFAGAPGLVLVLAASASFGAAKHWRTLLPAAPLESEREVLEPTEGAAALPALVGYPDGALILSATLMAGLQGSFILLVGGDWMPGARFVVPMLPPLCLLAALALRQWPFFLRLVMIGFLLASGVLHARGDGMLRWCRWAAKESGGLVVAPLVETGEYLRANAPPGATFAATEAGVMPYHSRLRFIDMLGLVDAHIASLPGGLHQKYDAEYVLGRAPELIVLGTVTTPDGEKGAWAPDQQMLANPRFAREYEVLHRIPRPMPDADFKRLEPGQMVVYRRRAPEGS